jgi:hypothetical protein
MPETAITYPTVINTRQQYWFGDPVEIAGEAAARLEAKGTDCQRTSMPIVV